MKEIAFKALTDKNSRNNEVLSEVAVTSVTKDMLSWGSVEEV